MSVAALVLNGGDGTSPKEPKWLAACTTDMTTTQLAEIMRKDVQDKPAQWHLGMNTLGFNAVVDACTQYSTEVMTGSAPAGGGLANFAKRPLSEPGKEAPENFSGASRRIEARAGATAVPTVEDRYAEDGKILRGARHSGQAMFNGGCGYHAVCGVGRGSARVTRGIEHAPTFCNGLRDQQVIVLAHLW